MCSVEHIPGPPPFFHIWQQYHIAECLPRPKLCLGERYCFTRVSLWFCLSVYLLFCDQDNSKSSRPISMKFGRTLGYYKEKVKFEFDKNYFGRTRTSSSWIFKIGISQKVISKFLLNFIKWSVGPFQRYPVNLKEIGLIERKPRPKYV